MMDRNLSSIRKAAILVATLDPASTRMLLAELGPEKGALVTQSVAGLGPLDPLEQETVLEEFLRLRPLLPPRHAAGIELDGSLPAQLAQPGPLAQSGPLAEPEQGSEENPARRREAQPACLAGETEIDWEMLAPLLEKEHPQTVAVVAAHLSPEQAARLLTALAPAIQADVMRRLVHLDETDPEILAEIEAQLQTWTARQKELRQRRRAGIEAISGILKAAGAGNQRILMSNLRQHDFRLAERLLSDEQPLGREQPTFAQLLQLEDQPLATLVREAEPELLVLALAGVEQKTMERIVSLLPSAEADRLRRELALAAPARLDEVELAQAELVRLAQQLQEQQRLTWQRRGLSIAA